MRYLSLLILILILFACEKKEDDAAEIKAADFYQDSVASTYGTAGRIKAGRLYIPPEVFLADKLLKRNLQKGNLISSGYLTFYIHDEFSEEVFQGGSGAVTATQEQLSVCINNPDYNNFEANPPYCDYLDSSGQTVNVLGWVKAAIEVWKLSIMDYLRNVVIPRYQSSGDLKKLVNEQLIADFVQSRKIVRTTNAAYADLIIWIPWRGNKYYRDRESGRECHMYYNDGEEVAPGRTTYDLFGTDRMIPYLHLPINDPKQRYSNSCFDFPVIIHEMGHAMGIADTYSYGDAYSMDGHPVNTLMRDLNGFSQNFIPARDDQLSITTVFLHKLYEKDVSKLNQVIDPITGCLQYISTPVGETGLGCVE